jgi:methanethiol S-methyltransferase
MRKFVALIYGLASYALFVVSFLYAIGFVDGFVVPKTINSGDVAPLSVAIMNNLRLLSLFAIQHSVMARKSFKRGGPGTFRLPSSAAPTCCSPA